MLGPMLLTWHNVAYYQSLMRGLRRAIMERRLDAHAASVRAAWTANEDPA
jgi:queuine tRNA-ribosyltransferase